MKMEFLIDEFYALNDDLIVKFSKIVTENKTKMIGELDYILLDWKDTYEMNLPITNIINPVFAIFSEVLDKEKSFKAQLLSELIIGWTNIYTRSIPNYTKLFGNDFFTEWYKAKQKDNELNEQDSHNFNILKMFHISETMHSQLLKLLLNPQGSHGQSNLFLSLFLESIGIKEPFQGTWKVTAEEGKIDLLLKRNNPFSIVVIENKSNWACDQQNQLYRYWYYEIYKKTKEVEELFYKQNRDSFQIIYLAPKGKVFDWQTITKPSGESLKELPELIPIEINMLTFNEDIFNWIEKCIEHLPAENHRMREYFKQYQEMCINL